VNILKKLQDVFRQVLVTKTPNAEEYVKMIHQSRRPGVDYQVNFCMKLGRELGRPPREVAQEIIDKVWGKDKA